MIGVWKQRSSISRVGRHSFVSFLFFAYLSLHILHVYQFKESLTSASWPRDRLGVLSRTVSGSGVERQESCGQPRAGHGTSAPFPSYRLFLLYSIFVTAILYLLSAQTWMPNIEGYRLCKEQSHVFFPALVRLQFPAFAKSPTCISLVLETQHLHVHANFALREIQHGGRVAQNATPAFLPYSQPGWEAHGSGI